MNGHVLPPPKDEAEAKVRRILDPISQTLNRVIGATKKKIPDDDSRLKLIKQGLVTIGNHIGSQVREGGYANLEDKMWEYVSEHHWPQSKQSEKRVSGHKLREMYKKIAGKDMANAKQPPSKPQPVTNGTLATEEKKESVKPARTLPDFKRESPELKRENSASKPPGDIKSTEPNAKPLIEVQLRTTDTAAPIAETKSEEPAAKSSIDVKAGNPESAVPTTETKDEVTETKREAQDVKAEQ